MQKKQLKVIYCHRCCEESNIPKANVARYRLMNGISISTYKHLVGFKCGQRTRAPLQPSSWAELERVQLDHLVTYMET